MIKREDLYAFIENNFDCLLVVDSRERILHASGQLQRACFPTRAFVEGQPLAEVLSESSLTSFRDAMELARNGHRAAAIFSARGEGACSLPLKSTFTQTTSGPVTLFFGSQIESIGKVSDWEKNERIKELACIYSVAEWMRASDSIDDFFSKLPDFLARGMSWPAETVVYAEYQGTSYGRKPLSKKCLRVQLVIRENPIGEICVGYMNDVRALLPEEQKMLDQIGRMIILTLEQKELSDRLLDTQEEEARTRRRLDKLKQEIDGRSREVKEQSLKLQTVNACLNRVNHDWEEARLRLETMFQAVPGMVALIDRDHNVIMTNRAQVAPHGKCYATFFDSNGPCADCRLARMIREKTAITTTLQHGDKYFEVQATPVFNPQHEVEGIIEYYRDVTLEKSYEQQIQQADKMAALGKLVSGIGHEINNPNQFIRGNVKIVRQALEDLLPIADAYYAQHPDLKVARLKYDFFREHILTLVDDMAHGTERIKHIVDGLRGFVRQDDGLLVDDVEINSLLEACVRLVHNEVHKHADIEMDLGDNIPPFSGNAQKIEQVLINLLVNAGQSIPEDRRGQVTIRSRHSGEEVLIEVEDNGKGMSDKVARQIFDPFFTTKRAKGGTGLGLAISYKIIEEHGGVIQVNSQPEHGTLFRIRIPAPAKPHPADNIHRSTNDTEEAG
ncbi:MAG: hypothetical protein EOM20_12050 [Spartobacteria bacterium]|nr:hypothetical protein [Spartobacteria bacterium]